MCFPLTSFPFPEILTVTFCPPVVMHVFVRSTVVLLAFNLFGRALQVTGDQDTRAAGPQ